MELSKGQNQCLILVAGFSLHLVCRSMLLNQLFSDEWTYLFVGKHLALCALLFPFLWRQRRHGSGRHRLLRCCVRGPDDGSGAHVRESSRGLPIPFGHQSKTFGLYWVPDHDCGGVLPHFDCDVQGLPCCLVSLNCGSWFLLFPSSAHGLVMVREPRGRRDGRCSGSFWVQLIHFLFCSLGFD